MGSAALVAGFNAIGDKELRDTFRKYPSLEKACLLVDRGLAEKVGAPVVPESAAPLLCEAADSSRRKEVPRSAFRILMPAGGWAKARSYLRDLRQESAAPSRYLLKEMKREGLEADFYQINYVNLVTYLLRSKLPQIFAESAVRGDGKDWNLQELSLLGDVSIAVPVTIFDNGAHVGPAVHAEPFLGTLLYTCGALLRPDKVSADWQELVTSDDELDEKAYYKIYERRLQPCFQYASDCAGKAKRRAFITIPGLGCGQFAGRFEGRLGQMLADVVRQILATHGRNWPHIQAVYYDAFRETEPSREIVEGTSIHYIVQPLGKSGERGRCQLCRPKDYEGAVGWKGDDFAQCELYSMVAWDHVSWPGNDYWGGSRATDDGVKAAATDSMFKLSGVEGHYNPKHTQYEPPEPYRSWSEVLRKQKIHLDVSSLEDEFFDVNGPCAEDVEQPATMPPGIRSDTLGGKQDAIAPPCDNAVKSVSKI